MILIPVQAAAGRYEVVVGSGLLASAGDLLKGAGLSGRLRLISDRQVYQIYGGRVEEALRGAGFEVATFQVPPGETSKSLEMASRLYDWLIDLRTERRDLVLALGGGVVGDLAGFAAATFLRGVRLVQLPTSLLAQVDSSVGGKVAVNHPRGKNLIGAFHPPSLVVADTSVLATLPRRELSAALAEVAKMGVILDLPLFEELERQGDELLRPGAVALETIIGRSVELKARVVQKDERETGLRAILNYGHTLGHAVEAVCGFESYHHGEAVALGMAGATRIAAGLGMIDGRTVERQDQLLRRLGLPTSCPGLPVERLLEAMALDKKASQGRLAWVLPEEIGRVVIRRDVPVALVEEVLSALTRKPGGSG